MKKIKTLFKRDWNNDPSVVTRDLDEGTEIIIDSKAIPTRKLDGTCCMFKDGKLYKRYDRKRRKKGKMLGDWKPEPPGWIPCEIDERTGHWWGWSLVDLDAPENWMHKEAVVNVFKDPGTYKPLDKPRGNVVYNYSDQKLVNFRELVLENDAAIEKETAAIAARGIPLRDGTYELCGPKVNGNPEGLDKHAFIPHGKDVLDFTFSGGDPYDEVKAWLSTRDIEGIVWWNDGNPVAKIKKRDLGLERH